jgi:lysophospholipase L1-like esterase
MRWRSYVALGDSFTEGLDDLDPATGTFRGWADLVAARLAAEDERFRYANLAVRGRLFRAIVDEQVPVALAMRPDLVSFAGGGNDVLRRSFDPAAMLSRFQQVVGSLRTAGADVIVFRWANVSGRLPGKRLVQGRQEFLNRAVTETAERHGALLVDLWHDDEFANPLLWSVDRLHLAPGGHRRVAAHVLTTLGVDPDPTWFDSPGPPLHRAWLVARAHDARWAGRYLAPWIKRRLTGRSSGDTITAKRPELAPIIN